MIDQTPPAMILCGGKGTRLRDVTELLPKPMVPIGRQPILWHIMRGYASFGVTRFILCLGYKREEFIDYFLNYHARSTDITIKLGREPGIIYHNQPDEEEWQVTLADTGLETMTGGRIRQAARYLKDSDQDFHLTYGDAVADIDVGKLMKTHLETGKMLTLSAVNPSGRFGEMSIENGIVTGFSEKPVTNERHINGGFMMMKKSFIDKYIPAKTDVFLEAEPITRATADGEAAAYFHEGFWQCMDTPREHQLLNNLWQSGSAPWTKWWQRHV